MRLARRVADAYVSYWRLPDGMVLREPMSAAEADDVIHSRHRRQVVVDDIPSMGALPFPPSVDAEHRFLGWQLRSGKIVIEPFTAAEQAELDADREYHRTVLGLDPPDPPRAWGWVRTADGALHDGMRQEQRYDTPSGELEPGYVTDAYAPVGEFWVACRPDGTDEILPSDVDVREPVRGGEVEVDPASARVLDERIAVARSLRDRAIAAGRTKQAVAYAALLDAVTAARTL